MTTEILDTHDIYPEAPIFCKEHTTDYGICPSCGQKFGCVYEYEESDNVTLSSIAAMLILVFAVFGFGCLVVAIRYGGVIELW